MKLRGFDGEAASLGSLLDRIAQLAPGEESQTTDHSGASGTARDGTAAEFGQAARLVRQFLVRMTELLADLDEATDACENIIRSPDKGDRRAKERKRTASSGVRDRLGELLEVSDALLASHRRARGLFERKREALEALAEAASGQKGRVLSAVAEAESDLDRLEAAMHGAEAGTAPSEGADQPVRRHAAMAEKVSGLRGELERLHAWGAPVDRLLGELQSGRSLMRAIGERLLTVTVRRVILHAAAGEIPGQQSGPSQQAGAAQPCTESGGISPDSVPALMEMHATGALMTAQTEDRRLRAIEAAERLFQEFRNRRNITAKGEGR